MILDSAQKVAEARWRTTMDDTERKLADVAERAHDIIPAFGATYRAAFFLKNYLANTCGIGATLTVGFINDGADDVYRSHAWLVFNGEITDIAISKFEGALEDRQGPVLIQGFELKPGKSIWKYHPARPENGRIGVQELVPDINDVAAIEHAVEIHNYMANVAKRTDLIHGYLSQAPDGLDYETLSARMD